MNMQTISTKTLREDFAQVFAAMQTGQPLMLLYRSKPLAEIRPVKQAKKILRVFSQQQLKQWVVSDRLTASEQKQVDAIINNLP